MNERVKPPSEVFLWVSLHGNTERKGALLRENRVAQKKKEKFFSSNNLKKKIESGHFKF